MALLGFNSGLLGSRRVPSSGSASGMWDCDEQSVARRAGIWPVGPNDDPYWADVALLLHLDGTNGSSSFPDSSPDNRSTSGSEYTTLSTTDPKFGTASAYFGNTITITPYISLGTGDFTIECFLFPDAFGRTVFARTDECFFVFISSDTVRFLCPGVGWVWLDSPQLSVPLQLNVWSHFALCKSGTTLRLFINGTLAATKVNFLPSDVPIDWFGVSTSSSVYYNYPAWLGRMDEIRVTRAARYTSDFTPPTTAFPNF